VGGSTGITRRLLRARFTVEDDRLAIDAFGLRFPNPLGAASGFDKNAVALGGLASLGFGHIEAGTATPLAQPGNPRPRIFRLAEDEAIINRMGFPNVGAERIRRNLQKQGRPQGMVVGMSVGKGRETPIERAHEDYLSCLSSLYEYADYFAINVSSPNTPELRNLQTKQLLEQLLRSVSDSAKELSAGPEKRPKPLLVKVSPDLDISQLEEVLQVALDCGVSGIIATNTSVERPTLTSHRRSEEGGLSGIPLKETSTRIIREIYKRASRNLVIVGSGGIFSAQDAWEKLTAGATLLQAYTGFIYKGPAFAKQVNSGLIDMMDKNGVKTISEVIGAASGQTR
jgi:dihydroorotate dehydrogenase